jgi:hypothetical protein
LSEEVLAKRLKELAKRLKEEKRRMRYFLTSLFSLLSLFLFYPLSLNLLATPGTNFELFKKNNHANYTYRSDNADSSNGKIAFEKTGQ